jgi:hypothetical protein
VGRPAGELPDRVRDAVARNQRRLDARPAGHRPGVHAIHEQRVAPRQPAVRRPERRGLAPAGGSEIQRLRPSAASGRSARRWPSWANAIQAPPGDQPIGSSTPGSRVSRRLAPLSTSVTHRSSAPSTPSLHSTARPSGDQCSRRPRPAPRPPRARSPRGRRSRADRARAAPLGHRMVRAPRRRTRAPPRAHLARGPGLRTGIGDALDRELRGESDLAARPAGRRHPTQPPRGHEVQLAAVDAPPRAARLDTRLRSYQTRLATGLHDVEPERPAGVLEVGDPLPRRIVGRRSRGDALTREAPRHAGLQVDLPDRGARRALERQPRRAARPRPRGEQPPTIRRDDGARRASGSRGSRRRAGGSCGCAGLSARGRRAGGG